jgi:hypothetical protein
VRRAERSRAVLPRGELDNAMGYGGYDPHHDDDDPRLLTLLGNPNSRPRSQSVSAEERRNNDRDNECRADRPVLALTPSVSYCLTTSTPNQKRSTPLPTTVDPSRGFGPHRANLSSGIEFRPPGDSSYCSDCTNSMSCAVHGAWCGPFVYDTAETIGSEPYARE